MRPKGVCRISKGPRERFRQVRTAPNRIRIDRTHRRPASHRLNRRKENAEHPAETSGTVRDQKQNAANRTAGANGRADQRRGRPARSMISRAQAPTAAAARIRSASPLRPDMHQQANPPVANASADSFNRRIESLENPHPIASHPVRAKTRTPHGAPRRQTKQSQTPPAMQAVQHRMVDQGPSSCSLMMEEKTGEHPFRTSTDPRQPGQRPTATDRKDLMPKVPRDRRNPPPKRPGQPRRAADPRTHHFRQQGSCDREPKQVNEAVGFAGWRCDERRDGRSFRRRNQRVRVQILDAPTLWKATPGRALAACGSILLKPPGCPV